MKDYKLKQRNLRASHTLGCFPFFFPRSLKANLGAGSLAGGLGQCTALTHLDLEEDENECCTSRGDVRLRMCGGIRNLHIFDGGTCRECCSPCSDEVFQHAS
jgi:hypothetical protein